MENQVTDTMENVANNEEVDPWTAAFAALEHAGEESAEGDTDAGQPAMEGKDGASSDAGGQQPADNDEAADSAGHEGQPGELGDLAGNDGQEDGESSGSLGIDQEYIEQYKVELNEKIRNQAIDDVAKAFIDSGKVRHRRGALGANIDDPDICKRDEDGVPRFYNPETGREFTGDNPRRQAQEWVDDYNKELARIFNDACAKYENQLMEEQAPALRVMEFAPKYEKLDPIRKGMFDSVVEDYEVMDDNGKVIGYSCDLDKALTLVDRQISMIQSYAKEHAPAKEPAKPTGPALDMKTSSGAVPSGDMPAPTSLAEAMERQQDALLDSMKKN